MVVTKVDQSLVVERKAAETVSHCKALETKTYSTIHVGYTVCFTANTFYNFSNNFNNCTLVVLMSKTSHLEVDFGSSSSHAEAEGWHINPTVTFPKDEEVILSERWELGKETLQGSIIIISDLREEQKEMQRLFPSFS